MFKDYKERVLLIYDHRQKRGRLSPELMHPSPANLKAECVRICDERFEKKDESLLRSFIGQKADAAAYRAAFQTDTADKFRPLSRFLQTRKTRPDERNIELLALLLNLNPRPYRPEISLPPVEDDDQPFERPIKGAGDGPIGGKKWIIALVILVLGSGFVYWQWPKTNKAETPRVSGVVKGKCMYWAGMQYAACPCNVTHRDTPIVPLDTIKLFKFKKIENATLSRNVVGKVWYAKLNSTIEVFSDSGFHPVDTNRRLLKLSGYMLDKYILHK